MLTYPISHLTVAFLIFLVASVVLWVAFGNISGAALCGAFFYIGREVTDLEKLHDWDMSGFDWPGLLVPLIPMLILEVAARKVF